MSKYPGPGWTPVTGKPNVYIHDATPSCEVEILFHHCPNCKVAAITYHAVCGCDDHGVSAEEDAARRKYHDTCLDCQRPYDKITLNDREEWPHEEQARLAAEQALLAELPPNVIEGTVLND